MNGIEYMYDNFIMPKKCYFTMGEDEFGKWMEVYIDRIVQYLRWIPKNSFRMGSIENDNQHTVTISNGFWMCDTVCTQEFWQLIMGDNPSYFTTNNNLGTPCHPVENIDRQKIQIFMNRLNRILRIGVVTLPTEAEWEYCCNGNNDILIHNNINILDVNHYLGKTSLAKTQPIDSFGLYQMRGNVWEWCADPLREFKQFDEIDPGLSNVKKLIDNNQEYCLRGGSWCNNENESLPNYRHSMKPNYKHSSVGFRWVLRPTLD